MKLNSEVTVTDFSYVPIAIVHGIFTSIVALLNMIIIRVKIILIIMIMIMTMIMVVILILARV